jgi:uncharacterized protein (DUF2461 family)
MSTGEALTRTPRGYPEDHPAARWLKLTSFTVGHPISDAQVTSGQLTTILAKDYETILPLVRWLNHQLGFEPAKRR